jgi:hypothetical protein
MILFGLIVVGVELLAGLIGLGVETALTTPISDPPAIVSTCAGDQHRSSATAACEQLQVEPTPVFIPPTPGSRDCRTVPFEDLRECMLGPGR